MPPVVHRRLPSGFTVLAGSQPPDDACFASDRLQVLWNDTDEAWHDRAPHAHAASDEMFVVLEGQLIVDVEGVRRQVGPNESIAFPAGVVHAVVGGVPPIRALVVRAPSVQDKVYPDDE